MHLRASFPRLTSRALARPQPGRAPGRGLAVATVAIWTLALVAGCSGAASSPHVPAANPRPRASTPAAAGTPAAAVVPAAAAGNPVPPDFEPVSMTFVSASEGWVLGTAPCAAGPCTSIVRTTDGGASWERVAAPPAPLASNGSAGLSPGLSYLRFASPLDGFAFGSQLWVTRDGGAGWQRVQLPGTIGDLETSAGLVYASVMSQDRTVTIYRSLASGGPWTPVPGLPAKVSGAPGRITLHGTAAWIILGGGLYATQAGQSWAREPVSCPPGYAMASAAAYSTQQVTLLCTGNSGTGSQGKILYSSSDGGASFTLMGNAPTGGDQFDQLAQPAAQHIFMAAFSVLTLLDVSGDGGRTWTTALNINDGGLGWSDFGFTTPVQGAAIYGNGKAGSHMYMTWDAGQTWHQITF